MANTGAQTIPAEDTTVEVVGVPTQQSTPRTPTSKVHIGGVPWNARISDLKSLMEGAGTLSELRITARKNRPQVLAVATYKSPTIAQSAVESLAQATLEGVPISVELSTKAPVSASGPVAADHFNHGKNVGRSRQHTVADTTSRRPREDDGEEGTTAATQSAETKPAAGSAATKPRSGGTSTKPRGRPSKAKAPKKAKEAKGLPSKTMLFVSHLSYSVKNDDLMELFAAYPATSAKIVYHRQRPTHSRGFAFVDFPNEAAQQKALADNNGKEVHGRTIAVSVALQPEEQPQESEQAETTPATGVESSKPTAVNDGVSTSA